MRTPIEPTLVIESSEKQYGSNLIQKCNNIQTDISSFDDSSMLIDPSFNIAGNYTNYITSVLTSILSIMKNYINENSTSLYENFSELNQKKDVMITYYKKNLSDEMATIAANIYDVTDFIFTKLDGSTALSYCDKENLAAAVIKKLLDESIISNDFLTAIADIYKNNVNLRSRVCFDIVFSIKNNDIKDPYKLPKNDQ